MTSNRKMCEIPKQDRPYEKCERMGPEALSDTELLAVILRTGSYGSTSVDLADKILDMSAGSGRGLLGIHHISQQELMRIPGIGRVKAIQIKCIGELTKRMARTQAALKLSFHDPESIADYYMEQMRHEEQEKLLCIMLDTKNHLLGEKVISKGTVNSSLISPRELFLEALRFQSVNIVLVHNHPSGDAYPSEADITVTNRIYQAGELLDVHLLDHIIIGDCEFFSFRRQKLIE